MQTASILLALGGKSAHQVPKYGVTPAEVAVLRVLHGDDAVTDIDVSDDDVDPPRTDRQEIERLRTLYSRQEGETVLSPAVNALFGSGMGVSVPKTFAELDLHDEQFAVKERKTKRDALDHDSDGKKGGVKKIADGGEKNVDKMSINELRAHADKIKADLNGLTRKDDILTAVKLRQEAIDAEAEAGSNEQNENADNQQSTGSVFE